jgi:hypothetical protein
MISYSVQCELGKETFCSVVKKPLDQDLDTSFIPSDCSESSDSSDNESSDVDSGNDSYESNIAEKNYLNISENVFLVFGDNILLLFKKYQKCGKETTKRRCSMKGTLFLINSVQVAKTHLSFATAFFSYF